MTDFDSTIPYGFCQCGCGQKTSIPESSNKNRNRIKGIPIKYIRGHNSKGANHSQWKGGKFIDSQGYTRIYALNQPKSYQNHALEHRAIAEKALGNPLPPNVVVHHHTPKQLVICQNDNYHKLLHKRQRALRACGHANWLKCPYCKSYDDPINMKEGIIQPYHRHCRNEHRRNKRRIARQSRANITKTPSPQHTFPNDISV